MCEIKESSVSMFAKIYSIHKLPGFEKYLALYEFRANLFREVAASAPTLHLEINEKVLGPGRVNKK